MSIRMFLVIAAAAALSACAGAPSGDLPSRLAAGSLRVEGQRLFLPVDVQGLRTEALLDSGAEITLIDPGFASAAGLVPFGHEEARGTGAGTQSVQFAEGVTLRAPGRVLADRTVVIMDLSDISARLIGRPLTVVLGREFFDAGRVRLDIDAGVIEAASDTDTPAGMMLELSDAHGIKQMPVSLNGHPAMADFDLGNGSEILVSTAFAEAAGLLAPENILGTIEGGGVGGPVQRQLVRVASLTIGDETFHNLTAAVGPEEGGADMNVGVSILRHFRMVIDFPENRVWLEPRR